jgi:hypothetical protein
MPAIFPLTPSTHDRTYDPLSQDSKSLSRGITPVFMMAPSSTSLHLLGLESSSPRSDSTTPVTPSQADRTQSQAGRIRSWWAQSWRDARADLKAARWGRGLLWVSFFLLTAGLLVTFIILADTASRETGFTSIRSACPPDGYFDLYGGFGYWQISGFFQITLPFGSLDFTQAKVIDIIWDVVSRILYLHVPAWRLG